MGYQSKTSFSSYPPTLASALLVTCALISAALLSYAGSIAVAQTPPSAPVFKAKNPTVSENSAEKNRSAIQPFEVLLADWAGPFGGTPPWRSIRPEFFVPALKKAIELENADLEKIVSQTEPPTFANTIVEMERAGAALNRIESIYYVHTSNLNVGPMGDIETVVEPMLTAHQDSVMQNAALFNRVRVVYENRQTEDPKLSPAQQRLLEKVYKGFVRQGAQLNEADKKKLSKINVELSSLFTRFSQNVLTAEGQTIVINDVTQLVDMPQANIDAFEQTEPDQPSQWVISNTRSAIGPVLTYADDRQLREKAWRLFYGRCDQGGEIDNNDIIKAILALRARRAKLLGYPTHAHWRLEPQMAKTPDQAMKLMMRVWPGAVEAVRQEVADMQAVIDRSEKSFPLEPWDYRYYAEKVRKVKFDLDLGEVKPYLQLDQLREGMMWSATKLFGLEFVETDGVEVFHPDVRVWEVRRSGDLVGLWYFDPFARSGKRSGAWMTSYRKQQSLDGTVVPLVSNNSNFVKGKPGETVLISWDDAETLFHEFGHALHGLCSQCEYQTQSGTAVARDFVEFPSQLFESWLSTPEVLSKFALHHQSGQAIPQALIEKIEKAATFNQGFATVEYLSSAIVDMKLHLAGTQTIDPRKFEKDTLSEIGMPDQIVMRHRTPHFSHVFAGDSYSAGYYSYLWAEALTADAAEAFAAAGFFDEATSKRLYDKILSIGDTTDAAEAFRGFRGRDVDANALFRKRGFPVQE